MSSDAPRPRRTITQAPTQTQTQETSNKPDTATAENPLGAFFHKSGESLLCATPVLKTKRTPGLGSKNKLRFLCITMRRGQLRVHKVKPSGTTGGLTVYQSQKAWRLEDLRKIDGEGPGQSNPHSDTDFMFKFEKSYNWRAATSQHKIALLWLVIVLSRSHLGRVPQITRLNEVELGVLVQADNLSLLYESQGKGLMQAAHALTDVRQSRSNTVTSSSQTSSAAMLLSSTEQADVESLFVSSGVGIADVDAFTESLSKENDASEAANIHAILESGKQVTELLLGIDTVVSDIDRMSHFINEYNTQLTAMRDIIKQIEKDNNKMEVVSRNNLSLLESLDELLARIQLNEETVHILSNPDLDSELGIAVAVGAAQELDTVIADPSISRMRTMRAVSDQLRKFTDLRASFATKAFQKLKTLTEECGNSMLANNQRFSSKGRLVVPEHRDSLHSVLSEYSAVTKWLKKSSTDLYDQFREVYTDKIKKVYKKELSAFVHELKSVILKRKMESRFLYLTSADRDRGKSIFDDKDKDAAGSVSAGTASGMMMSLSKSSSRSFLLHPSMTISHSHSQGGEGGGGQLGRSASVSSDASYDSKSSVSVSASDHQSATTTATTGVAPSSSSSSRAIDFFSFITALTSDSDISVTESLILLTKGSKKVSYDTAFKFLLGTIVPIIAAEQNFIASMKGVGVSIGEDGDSSSDDEDGVEATPQEVMAANQMPVSDQWEVSTTLSAVFGSLPDILSSLVAKAEKIDDVSLIGILAACRDYQNRFGDHSVFLSNILEPLSAKSEEAFNKYVGDQATAITELKATARRAGILQPVSRLCIFIDLCESFFQPKSMVVREVLEKAYKKIGDSVIACIHKIAMSDSKYTNVVMLENCHHVLSRVKKRAVIVQRERKEAREGEGGGEGGGEGEGEGEGEKESNTNTGVLDELVQTATNLYNKALRLYISYSIKCEFGSLFEFFDGIKEMMDSGVPSEEIKYRFSHSIQAYKKLSKHYTQKEIDKGVLAMKKRVEKHLCKEEGLFNVIWKSVASTFRDSYTQYANLAIACYPESTPMPSLPAETLKLIGAKIET